MTEETFHILCLIWGGSALIVFFVLIISLLLISRFGWMLSALIFAALVADIVFLPALLAGPLGRIIRKSIARRHDLPTASEPRGQRVRPDLIESHP